MLRDAGAIRDVIDALKAMCKRAGIDPELKVGGAP
jgi:hypothetical protein